MPGTKGEAGERDGVGDEVENPMAEYHEPNDHARAETAKDALEQESSSGRPANGHEKAVRPRKSLFGRLNARIAECDREDIEKESGQQKNSERHPWRKAFSRHSYRAMSDWSH